MARQIAIEGTQLPAVGPAAQAVALADRALARLADGALAPATRRAYGREHATWAAWCDAIGCDPIDVDTGALLTYLEHRASTCAPSTVRRSLAAISALATAAGHPSLYHRGALRSWLAAYHREHGYACRGAPALDRAGILAVLDGIEASARTGRALAPALAVRDYALVLVGWLGALRASEIAALDRGDVEVTSEGLRLTVRRSKTDQAGAGHVRGLARGASLAVCPVEAWSHWRATAACERHPLAAFCRLTHHARGSRDARLGVRSIHAIVRGRAHAVGLAASAHSLRAGFATAAARAGVADRDIQRHGGWTSTRTVDRYVRDGALFERNPTAGLL